MKKILKTLGVAFLATVGTLNVQAQGIYLQGQLGYAFPAGGQEIMSNVTDKTIEMQSYSLANGANAGVGAGYMFNQNVGAELGVNYLMGGTVTSKIITGTFTTTNDWKGSMLRITPSFVVSVPMESITIYGRMGLAVGMMPSVMNIYKRTDGSTSGTKEMEEKFSGGMGLGLSSAAGLGFGLSDKLHLFAELNYVSMSYRPEKSVVIKATDGGKDVLPDMTTSEKETEYVTEFDSDKYKPSDSQPTVMPLTNALNFPFSSVGVNLGIRFMLGK